MSVNNEPPYDTTIFSSKETIVIVSAVILAVAAIAIGVLALKTRGVNTLDPLHILKTLNNRVISGMIGTGSLVLLSVGLGIYVKVRLSQKPRKVTYQPLISHKNDDTVGEKEIKYKDTTNNLTVQEWLKNNQESLNNVFVELKNGQCISKQKKLDFICK